MHPRLTPQTPEVKTIPLATHIVVVLDESSSMSTKRAETIGAFNKFLEEQKKLPGECQLSLVKFNSNDIPVHNRMVLASVPALDNDTYCPGGYTALLDAMGRAVEFASTDKDVIVCVLTDGEENSSKSYTLEKIKALVEEKTKGGWNFIYLCAGLNAFATGGAMGFTMTNIVQADNTGKGLSASIGTVSYASAKFRSGDKTLDAGELVRNYTSNLSKTG